MSRQGNRIVFLEGGDCVVEPFTVPDTLEAGEVLVRNEASLVSPGTELAILRRRHRAFAADEPSPFTTFPFYPGYAEVGRIEAVGPGVDGFSVGDRVWHPSSHATLSVVSVERCLPVPDGIEPRDAVFYGLVEIAMTALRRAPIELGETVLVSGLGLVGILVGRLYRIAGASVVAADRSRGRLRRGERMGFGTLIDLNETSLRDWYAAHPGAAPDVAVEAAGIESNIDACLKVTKPGGRVVLQGSPRKTMEIDPYTDIHRKGLSVIGAHVMTVPPEVRKRDVPYLFELCRAGLQLEDIRTHELPYTDAPALYDRLEDSLDDYLGVVLNY